jgi:hypothetical protein
VSVCVQLAAALQADAQSVIGTCNDWTAYTTNTFLDASGLTERVYDLPCAYYTLVAVGSTNLLLVVVDVKRSCATPLVTLPHVAIAYDTCPATFNAGSGTPACPPAARSTSNALNVDVTGLKPCLACNLGLSEGQCAMSSSCVPVTIANDQGDVVFLGCQHYSTTNASMCPTYPPPRRWPEETNAAVIIGAAICGSFGGLILLLVAVFCVRRHGRAPSQWCYKCARGQSKKPSPSSSPISVAPAPTGTQSTDVVSPASACFLLVLCRVTSRGLPSRTLVFTPYRNAYACAQSPGLP